METAKVDVIVLPPNSGKILSTPNEKKYGLGMIMCIVGTGCSLYGFFGGSTLYYIYNIAINTNVKLTLSVNTSGDLVATNNDGSNKGTTVIFYN